MSLLSAAVSYDGTNTAARISRALHALMGKAMLHHGTHTALLSLQVVQGDVFNDPGCVADPAADVWSLGAIACEMLQGKQYHTNSMLHFGRLCTPCFTNLVTAAGPKQLSPQLRPWQQICR